MIRYIGRIKLTKEDSDGWCGKPAFMYVTRQNNCNRDNIDHAELFTSRSKCEKRLKHDLKEYNHIEYGSKGEILELDIVTKKVTEI